jgi:hypothetical protein
LPSIHVSGIKNKMGLCNFSTMRGAVQHTQNGNFNDNIVNKKNDEFLHWFSGFTDAEGNFLITIDRSYVKLRGLRHKISLYISSFFFLVRRWFIKLLSDRLFMYPVKTEGLKTKIGTSISYMRYPTLKLTNLQINSGARYYSSKINNDLLDNEIGDIVDESTIKLNPQWISGFTDAEGCFMIQVLKVAGKTGWGVSPSFVIHLHSKDMDILYALQNYFGVGKVYVNKNGKSASYIVKKLKDIVNVIIPHFKNYPLQSGKCIDLQLWLMCIDLLVNKAHLTTEGLNKVISTKYALNKGLPESLKISFKDVKPLNRPEYKSSNTPLDPDWVSGFSEGDSSFLVSISDKTNQVRVIYSLGLNDRDLPLILKLQEFFGGIGKIANYDNVVQYSISDLNNIRKVLIPHFDTYNLKGNKLYNYLIWKEIINLMENKSHLTSEGLEKIYNLRHKLNLW